MNKQDFLEAGQIIKVHGIHGEVIIEAKDSDLFKNILESVFLEIDGLLVPFFISDIKATSNNRIRVKFDWIDSENQAKNISNCPVFISNKDVSVSEEQFESNLQLLNGFLVTDTNLGELGIIQQIIDNPNNPLMVLSYKKQEILIPLHPDFIKKINQQKKTLTITCPEGLIDIYFE